MSNMNEDLRLKRLSFYNKLMVDSSLDLKSRKSVEHGDYNSQVLEEQRGEKIDEQVIKDSLNKIIDDSFALARLKRSKSLVDSEQPIDSKSILDKIFGAYDTQSKLDGGYKSKQQPSSAASGVGSNFTSVTSMSSSNQVPKVRKFSQSISFDESDSPPGINSGNLSTNRKLEEFRRIVESSQLQHIQTNNLLKQIGESISPENNNNATSKTNYTNSASSVNKDSQSLVNKNRKSSIDSSHHSLLNFPLDLTSSPTIKSELNSFRYNESNSSQFAQDGLPMPKVNVTGDKTPYKMSYMSAYNVYDQSKGWAKSGTDHFSTSQLAKQESVESFDESPPVKPMSQSQLPPAQSMISKHLSSNGSSLNTSPTSTSSVESMKKATPDFMLDAKILEHQQHAAAITVQSNYEIKPPETPRSKVPSFRKNLVKAANGPNVNNHESVAEKPVQNVQQDLNTQISERVVETVVKNAVNKLNAQDELDIFFNSKEPKQTVNTKDSAQFQTNLKKSLKSSSEVKGSSVFRLADLDQNDQDYTLNNNSHHSDRANHQNQDEDDAGSDTFDMFSSQESLNKEPTKLDSITNSKGEKIVFGKQSVAKAGADKLDLRIDLGQLSDADDYVESKNVVQPPHAINVTDEYPAESNIFRSSRSNSVSARQQIKPQNIPNLALDLMDDDRSQSVAASLAKSMCKEIDYQQEMELICKKHQIMSIQPPTTMTTTSVKQPAAVNKSKSFKSGGNLLHKSSTDFFTELHNTSTSTTPRYSSRVSPAVVQPPARINTTSQLQILKLNETANSNINKQKIINSTMNQENIEIKSYFMKAPQSGSRPSSARKLEPIKLTSRANSPSVPTAAVAALSRPPSSLVKDKKTANNLMRKSVAGTTGPTSTNSAPKVTVFSYLKNEESLETPKITKSKPRRQQHWQTSSNIVRSSSAVGIRNRSPSPLVSKEAKNPASLQPPEEENESVVAKSTALFLNYSKLVEIESNFNKEYEEIMANADAYLKRPKTAGAVDSSKTRPEEIVATQSEIKQSSNETRQVDWLTLPDEIWLNILENLNHKDLVRLGLTCKALYRLYQDNTLWRRITLKYKYDMCDEWLNWIGRRRPSELNIIQCSGTLTLYAISEMFKMIGTNLHTLNLSRCSNGSLSGDNFALQASIRCPNVTNLDLSWTLLSNQTLKLIADSFKRIESINLSGCNMIQEDGFNFLLQKHGESIKNLEISGCIHFSPNCVLNIGVYCRNIERLNLSNCHRMTNESVIEAAPHWLKLKFIDLRGIKAIKNNCISILVRKCLHLEGLALADCIHISDASVLEISTYKPNIKYLDFNGCKKIGDNSVRSIANFCSKLENLNLKGTTVTDNGLISLSNGKCRVSLEELNLSYLPISELVLGKILKNYERLKSIYLYGCYNIKRVDEIKKSIDLRSCLTINI